MEWESKTKEWILLPVFNQQIGGILFDYNLGCEIYFCKPLRLSGKSNPSLCHLAFFSIILKIYSENTTATSTETNFGAN